ncbi:1-acyl-sn-glycerol-3-phosphate acyltransferase [Microbacteriaceae bacterium SG_E_30_P1]|uniref:1-acyl-sn-glycerol-3-phosphate acyltransferase n=1 Tax=Antiquaquibacter oligotrophicus TaxID=2880260 RepID=A0ABT6KME5_9MICO|nr:lysophospholipid acyltransferase family protein [Antiquaquibacter oligotrophicus]MDH6181188.1 1-acyl-sn-glycerol-3-phosphate acyltransferase [Antiquaquibacter oligotrophicus]UDF13117.1 1-acyl-sn-glycerol-3-phosphate acyltransferase [Antiquaquibacter oligotrophicus]
MTRDRFTSRSMAAVRFVAQRGLLKPLVWSLVSVDVVGRDRIAALDAPFIVIANHSSHLDAPLVLGALPRRHARYLAAGAAADYFFDVAWRKWLTTLFFNAFAVERNSEGKRSGASRSLLERKVPLLLFPEGGRSRHGEMGRFKPGAAALSIASGAPCVPVALVGASAAMPRGVNWPKRGRMPVSVVIGEPMIAREGESTEDFSRRLAAEVRDLHESVLPMPVRQHAKEGRT